MVVVGLVALIYSIIFFIITSLLFLELLWMPFAALICGIMARNRGLSVRRYAIAGALYSALFMLPWLYFWAKLSNRSIPGFLVVLGYLALYGVIWPSTAAYAFIVVVSKDVTYYEMVSSFLMVFIIISGLAWIISLAMLILWRAKRRATVEGSSNYDFLPLPCIMPFVCAVCLVVFLALVTQVKAMGL